MPTRKPPAAKATPRPPTAPPSSAKKASAPAKKAATPAKKVSASVKKASTPAKTASTTKTPTKTPTAVKKSPAKESGFKPHGTVPVLGKDVYVRTGPRSWVIGTLFGKDNNHPVVKHKDSFDAQKGAINGYVWGRAFGNVNRCGYVERQYLAEEVSSRHSNDCGHAPNSREENHAYLCKAFAVMTNSDDNAGTSVKTKKATTLYANFDGNQPLDPIFEIPAGRNVGWRWVTQGRQNGHRYVMVNFEVRERDQPSYYRAGTSLWGFVKLSDLEDLPGTRPC